MGRGTRFHCVRASSLVIRCFVFTLGEPAGSRPAAGHFSCWHKKSNQKKCPKCERTFDRACEPLAAIAPLEFRLEMRSVCAVPYVPPQLRGTGAPAVPPNSPTYTLRAGAAQALLAFWSWPRPPLPYLGASVGRKAQRTLTASVAPRPESTGKQRLLCMGAKRSSDQTVGGYGWRSRTSELRWYVRHSAH